MDRAGKAPEGTRYFHYVAVFFLLLTLPGIQWPALSWICGLIPLCSFFTLFGLGWNRGNTSILLGAVLSGMASVSLHTLPYLLVPLTALPAGYVLAYSAGKSEAQIRSGMNAALTLGCCWLLLWVTVANIDSTFSYSGLIRWLQDGVDVSLNIYRKNQTLPVDTLVVVDQVLSQMKVLLPKIMPAVLASIVLCNVWLAMAIGNMLLFRFFGKSPWPDFKLWKLPEQFIWAEIFPAILALTPIDTVDTIGLDLLLIVSVVFVFQGISIVVFFFNKWNMPMGFRWLLYMLAVLQSSGTIFLLAIGIADTWLDFRRLHKEGAMRDV